LLEIITQNQKITAQKPSILSLQYLIRVLFGPKAYPSALSKREKEKKFAILDFLLFPFEPKLNIFSFLRKSNNWRNFLNFLLVNEPKFSDLFLQKG
jgi:hypothetical protein